MNEKQENKKRKLIAVSYESWDRMKTYCAKTNKFLARETDKALGEYLDKVEADEKQINNVQSEY